MPTKKKKTKTNNTIVKEIIKDLENNIPFILKQESLLLTDEIYNKRFKILLLEVESQDKINSFVLIKIKKELIEIESDAELNGRQIKETQRILSELKAYDNQILKVKIKDIFRLFDCEDVGKIDIRDWLITKMRKIKNKFNYDLVKYKKKYCFIEFNSNETIDSDGNLTSTNEEKLKVGGPCIFFK